MKLPFSEPVPIGTDRAHKAKEYRDLATEISRLHPQAVTRANGEENDHGPKYPANFTKGLQHDDFGVLADDQDYACFVEAINAPDPSLFEKDITHADQSKFSCTGKVTCDGKADVEWRGWESPRAGHVYELQGPDAGAVGMAPAPRVGSSELAAEMAEVYALALLRDVPFTEICEGGDTKLCDDKKDQKSELSADQIAKLLAKMPFYSGKKVQSSTPHTAVDGYNGFERRRRDARTLGKDLKPETLFRGSTKGAQTGPYISQFMLIGARSLACAGGGRASFPGTDAKWDLQDGFIPYGSLAIDQRTITATSCLDYMTDWHHWLDVQNGADLRGADTFEDKRRFITTPRDLATYVHYDALYEAYLNACLILLAMGTPSSKGFPEPSRSGHRTAFATYGGPHILSLVCEVATRCLKAVRRQKFNYHRRARPEALGGRFTLSCLGLNDPLGCAAPDFAASLAEIDGTLQKAIIDHNAKQNGKPRPNLICKEGLSPPKGKKAGFDECNLLLPMAFPEGSPMHPAYGAGHATVAGGCVTMLKAFFEMFEDCNGGVERKLEAGGAAINYVPNADGTGLVKSTKGGTLTIQGELDKLAANISIGRNMAGVHYYSDYYDSLRMGERIAVGIIMEQAPSYGEVMEITFKSFDGDMITITGELGACPAMSIIDKDGTPVSPESWWLRHVPGSEISLDL